MSTRSIAATAVTLSALPIALGALVWHGFRVRREHWVQINPFEIDLQLHERNDEV